MKTCTVCREAKSETEYHKCRKTRSGLSERCKPCAAISYKASRDKNIELRRASEKARHDKRRRSPEFQERERERGASEYKRKRKKRYAYNAVQWALSSGRLAKGPCETCGSDKSVAHHDDYDKPLDVRWLCGAHHSEWHSKNGPGANSEGQVTVRASPTISEMSKPL